MSAVTIIDRRNRNSPVSVQMYVGVAPQRQHHPDGALFTAYHNGQKRFKKRFNEADKKKVKMLVSIIKVENLSWYCFQCKKANDPSMHAWICLSKSINY